jgi:hypothetical protein
MAYAMNEVAANPMQAAAFLRSESQPAKCPTQVSISFGERTDRAALRQAWEAVCSEGAERWLYDFRNCSGLLT